MKELSKEEKYLKLIERVKEFESSLVNEKTLEQPLKKYYRGIQILLSPLHESTDFMLIGINPGAGYFNEQGKNVKRFSPLKNFEYLKYNYSLARETRKVFEMAQLSDKLKNAVKTNCFYLATQNQHDLHKLLSHLKDLNAYTLSRKWTDELIEIVRPKIIIAEGIYAFNSLLHNKNAEVNITNGIHYAYHNGYHYIGYKRIMSFIKNKKELSELIRKIYIPER